MTRCLAWITAAATVASAVGCGGTTSVGSDARPAPDPLSPTSTPEVVFTASDVDAARARCNAPHGVVDGYSSVDALVARLTTTWFLCPGAPDASSPLGDGRYPVGVEFTVDGHFYWLVEDDSYGAVRGRGIAAAAAYEIEPPYEAEYNNVSYAIDVRYADRSTMSTYATFEAAPRRLLLQFLDATYFVPLTHTSGGER